MKKTLLILASALLLAAAGVALYRFSLRKSIPEAPSASSVETILCQNDCFVCHSSNPKAPFYASFPLIGPMIQKHIAHGSDFVLLEDADLEHPSEVLLSMIEYSVTKGNMPPAEYSLIHWGTGFNRSEKSLLSSYLRNSRTELYGAAIPEEPIEIVPDSLPVDPLKVELGKKMFNDVRISLDNTVSCASCHILRIGGADEYDERTSLGINNQAGGANAPTVYNSAFNIRQFWNGRAEDLREQAAGPPENPVEMGDQSWAQIVERLSRDKALVGEFEALYPGEGLSQYSVTDAIAEYEKTLLTPGCRFDKYLSGDSSAISQEELEGYYAFKNNGCATCHTGTILGGQSFEKLGIFEDYFADRASRRPDIAYNSDDDGLKGYTLREEDLHKFKTPQLRNIALTPPYFHDGSYSTLDEAVEAMFRFEFGLQEVPASDVRSIVLFLDTLTGEHEELE